MVDHVRRRLIQHANHQEDYDTSYADRPPPTPSPTSMEYHSYRNEQQFVEDEQLFVSAINSHVSLTRLQQTQPHQYLHDATSSSNRGEFFVPSYDETISRDQELVNAATRMSVSSSVQSVNNVPSEGHQIHSRTHSQTNIQYNSSDTDNSSNLRRQNQNLLKILGLNFLNARQHLALAICRDFVLIPPLYHAFICFKTAYYLDHPNLHSSDNDTTSVIVGQLISPGSSEHFIAGIWCLVAAYLSFTVIDGLVVRWIVTYQTSAAILRVLSMSMLLITIEQATLAIFSPGGTYSLHTWILISCILTGAYILQNFVTSNLDLKNENKARSVDYYSITVYAVVPVGLASFVSMIGLLRALLILRLDIENRELGTDKMTKWIF